MNPFNWIAVGNLSFGLLLVILDKLTNNYMVLVWLYRLSTLNFVVAGGACGAMFWMAWRSNG